KLPCGIAPAGSISMARATLELALAAIVGAARMLKVAASCAAELRGAAVPRSTMAIPAAAVRRKRRTAARLGANPSRRGGASCTEPVLFTRNLMRNRCGRYLESLDWAFGSAAAPLWAGLAAAGGRGGNALPEIVPTLASFSSATQ